MPTMTGFEFGDVVLVASPFTDHGATKRRPAIVVSSNAYNRETTDLIILAVTSQARSAPMLGEVSIESWKEAGLLKPSVLKPILTTIERSLVLRRLGRLEQADLAVLREVLAVIIGR